MLAHWFLRTLPRLAKIAYVPATPDGAITLDRLPVQWGRDASPYRFKTSECEWRRVVGPIGGSPAHWFLRTLPRLPEISYVPATPDGAITLDRLPVQSG